MDGYERVEPANHANHANQANQAEQELERRLCNALVVLAGDPDGLLLLRWLITRQCGVLSVSYPDDHTKAAWTEGRRSIGVELVALARCAGVLATILKES